MEKAGRTMIVMKFGGTSVEHAQAIRNVANIVIRYRDRKPLVVSSACAGVTNALLALARSSQSAGRDKALDQAEQIRVRHRKIAHDLFSGDVLFTVQSQIDAMVDDLCDIVKSISILGELTDRSRDVFAGFGERLSTLLLTHCLKQEGVPAVLLPAGDIMVTSADYTRAVPRFDLINANAKSVIAPMLEAGQVVVTQGFIGATVDGIPTTIGRGGSDYSAAIFGAALDVEEIQIWTDVDGVMTSDPSLIKDARVLEEMTFQEAAELAYFGAKVLHPATIQPAVAKNIPVRVLNSRRPDVPGTVIVRDSTTHRAGGVTSIAYKEKITLVTISSTRMLMMHGFLAKIFAIFAAHEKSIDVIATSEVSVSLTVDSPDKLDEIFEEIRPFADVEQAGDKAIFCVVGDRLKSTKGVIPKIFSTLEEHSIRVGLISLGASEVNVTFVVDGKDIKQTAVELHRAFFDGQPHS
jgi:aspartate kinase